MLVGQADRQARISRAVEREACGPTRGTSCRSRSACPTRPTGVSNAANVSPGGVRRRSPRPAGAPCGACRGCRRRCRQTARVVAAPAAGLAVAEQTTISAGRVGELVHAAGRPGRAPGGRPAGRGGAGRRGSRRARRRAAPAGDPGRAGVGDEVAIRSRSKSRSRPNAAATPAIRVTPIRLARVPSLRRRRPRSARRRASVVRHPGQARGLRTPRPPPGRRAARRRRARPR